MNEGSSVPSLKSYQDLILRQMSINDSFIGNNNPKMFISQSANSAVKKH